MPDPYLVKNSQEAKRAIKSMEKEGVVKEGESEQEVIQHEIDFEKRQELEKELEEFQEDLHETEAAVPVAQGAPHTAKSEFLLRVEDILADGLGDVYQSMDMTLRQRFKAKGEDVALKIEAIIVQGKATVKKILHWIKEWLKMIPCINKFFLEQEAKIKTDTIVSLMKKV